jgi:hypothetical protein
MDILLGWVLFLFIIIWSLQERPHFNRRCGRNKGIAPPEKANSSPNTNFDSQSKREQGDPIANAKMQKIYIRYNSTEPDKEGFVGRRGARNREFIIWKDRQIIHRGRIQIVENEEYIAMVKDKSDPNTIRPIDLRYLKIE